MSPLEKEMMSFDFATFQAEVEASRRGMATAASADDLRDEIGIVWSKTRKFVKMSENIPVVGRHISLLAGLLDAICVSSE